MPKKKHGPYRVPMGNMFGNEMESDISRAKRWGATDKEIEEKLGEASRRYAKEGRSAEFRKMLEEAAKKDAPFRSHKKKQNSRR